MAKNVTAVSVPLRVNGRYEPSDMDSVFWFCSMMDVAPQLGVDTGFTCRGQIDPTEMTCRNWVSRGRFDIICYILYSKPHARGELCFSEKK